MRGPSPKMRVPENPPDEPREVTVYHAECQEESCGWAAKGTGVGERIWEHQEENRDHPVEVVDEWTETHE